VSQAVPAHERLAATQRFLVTGRSYEDLKFAIVISPYSLSKLIPDTCRAMYKVMKKDILYFSDSQPVGRPPPFQGGGGLCSLKKTYSIL
jgi:hypothetical protein